MVVVVFVGMQTAYFVTGMYVPTAGKVLHKQQPNEEDGEDRLFCSGKVPAQKIGRLLTPNDIS